MFEFRQQACNKGLLPTVLLCLQLNKKCSNVDFMDRGTYTRDFCTFKGEPLAVQGAKKLYVCRVPGSIVFYYYNNMYLQYRNIHVHNADLGPVDFREQINVKPVDMNS